MRAEISKWVNLNSCSLNSIDFADKCRQKLSDTGVLLLPQFLLPEALNQTIKEAQARAHLAYFTKNTHNVYLSEPDTSLPEDHVFNRQVKSSKGCITTNQIQSESGLHVIYNSSIFKNLSRMSFKKMPFTLTQIHCLVSTYIMRAKEKN